MMRARYVVFLAVVMGCSGSGQGRVLNSSFVWDGIDDISSLADVTATTVTCEATYGFLPCTSTVWGQLFLLLVYEYLLALAEKYVASGSELFFEMFGTGIFGGSLFQMFGMIPQVALVIASGFSGSTATVEAMATMGMAMVAGSVIMNLTLLWGCIVAFGSYDLSQPPISSSNQENTPVIPQSSTTHGDTDLTTSSAAASTPQINKTPFSLTGYGVTTDNETSLMARIMLISMLPFLILQLARVFTSSTGTRVIVLIALLVSAAFLILYCTYQVFQPWIQNRRLEYLLSKYVQKYLVQSLLTGNGTPSVAHIKELFHKIDQDNNTYISAAEMRTLIIGIQIEEVGLRADDFVTKIMTEFDLSGNSKIDETEFVNGLTKLLNEVNNPSSNDDQSNSKKSDLEEQQSLLGKANNKKKSDGSGKSSWWNYSKAAYLVIVGTAITFVLGQPLMLTLQEFSTAINIPSFLVSYVLTPLALTYRMTLRVISSASHKTENAMSLTFSQMYGGVFMNNVMGLTVFLLLVYLKDLSWDVSAEILIVLIICTGMGLYASFSTKFPFWICIVSFLLYPLSLLFIYVLTEIFGWA